MIKEQRNKRKGTLIMAFKRKKIKVVDIKKDNENSII